MAFLLVLYLCILLMLTGKHFLLWLDALLPHVSIVWSWTWLFLFRSHLKRMVEQHAKDQQQSERLKPEQQDHGRSERSIQIFLQ